MSRLCGGGGFIYGEITYLFSHLFGVNGIAIGMGLSFIVSSVFAYGYYRYGKWRKKDLFHTGSEIGDTE